MKFKKKISLKNQAMVKKIKTQIILGIAKRKKVKFTLKKAQNHKVFQRIFQMFSKHVIVMKVSVYLWIMNKIGAKILD